MKKEVIMKWLKKLVYTGISLILFGSLFLHFLFGISLEYGEGEHKLEIFRGLIRFKSNVQKIWGVLFVLSVITTVEVVLGILKPQPLLTMLFGMKVLNWIFIILTILKAYYITWDFMHVRDERDSLKGSVVLPLIILIPYLDFILLLEADYIFNIMIDGFVSWNF